MWGGGWVGGWGGGVWVRVLDHSCIKHRSVYSKGRECPGSEKTALNKQREDLVSQNKTVI